MIGPIIGALASVAGGMMGASAEKKAAKENRAIAEMNLKFEREQFEYYKATSERLEKEGKLGGTDAYGNQYKYVEGKGWQVILSDRMKFMQQLQLREAERGLGQDADLRRQQIFANADRQRGEGRTADQLLRMFNQVQMPDPTGEVGQRNLLTAQGMSEANRPILEKALQQARATGNVNAGGDIASKMGVAQGDALRKAFLENNMNAREGAQQSYQNERGNIANLYNMFRTGASALAPQGSSGPNVEGSANAQMGSFQQGGAQGNQALMNFAGSKAPQLNYQAPVQYGMANTMANLGGSLGNMDFSNIFGGSSSGGGQQYSSNVFPPAPSNQYRSNTNDVWGG